MLALLSRVLGSEDLPISGCATAQDSPQISRCASCGRLHQECAYMVLHEGSESGMPGLDGIDNLRRRRASRVAHPRLSGTARVVKKVSPPVSSLGIRV